jgi:hypothetical protein
MSKVTRPIIVLMGVITLVGLPSMGRAQIVDPFTGRLINHEIWRGGENQGDAGTQNTETSRAIKGGTLEMSLTSFGKTDSDAGNAGNASTRLRLLNPGGLTQLQADIKIVRAEAQACQANTTPSRPRARIIGAFFNDGSSSGPDDETGDVIATIQMVLDSSSGREISLSVFRCLDALCIATETTPFSSGGFVGFTSTWRQGQKRTLNLLWDQANKQFVGTIDAGRPTEEVHVISYVGLPDGDTPGFDFKDLRVQTLEANCTAGATKSAVTARFDNFIAQ